MSNKFYAVRKGKCKGIFLTWADCKKQIDGESYAEYKSFLSIIEAAEYLSVQVNVEKPSEPTQENQVNQLTDVVKAYVDGSYNIRTKEYSYGLVIPEKNYITGEKFNDPELATMRNVAGEIKGAEAAMKYALNHGLKEIAIYYDYEGIAKWCLGQWKTNKDGTKAYKAFYDQIKDKVKVTFVKVDAHVTQGGDYHNDQNNIVDAVAKQLAGVETKKHYEIQEPPK